MSAALQKTPNDQSDRREPVQNCYRTAKRQDDALEQLESLCERVEQAIEFNTNSREVDTEAESDENTESTPDETQRKAA